VDQPQARRTAAGPLVRAQCPLLPWPES
jgi:hypothetical protein